MNLDVIRPRNRKEELSLSITKNCGTLFKQTHTKSQETLKFKLIQPRVTFSFKPSINLGLDTKWLIGLTILGVINLFLT